MGPFFGGACSSSGRRELPLPVHIRAKIRSGGNDLAVAPRGVGAACFRLPPGSAHRLANLTRILRQHGEKKVHGQIGPSGKVHNEGCPTITPALTTDLCQSGAFPRRSSEKRPTLPGSWSEGPAKSSPSCEMAAETVRRSENGVAGNLTADAGRRRGMAGRLYRARARSRLFLMERVCDDSGGAECPIATILLRHGATSPLGDTAFPRGRTFFKRG